MNSATGQRFGEARRFIMFTRRHLLKAGAAAGAATLAPVGLARAWLAFADPVPGGTLDPARIPKYVQPLFILPAMPGGRNVAGTDYHEISARQFTQRILPPGLPTTPVFGYGRTGDSST